MDTSLRNLFGLEQMLESCFQAFTDLILGLDYDGLILDSRWGMQLPPIFPGEIMQREIREVFPYAAAEKSQHALKFVQQTETVANLEFSRSVQDREYWFDVRLVPLSKSQAILTARDVTKYHETERREPPGRHPLLGGP